MANSVSGMVRPRAVAVLRLMRSSIFVDCWTGRSEGLSPLRIHSITSSARSKIDCGTVRLSALAVLRLMTNWNLTGS